MKHRSTLLIASLLLLGISHGWCSGSELARPNFRREHPLPSTPPTTRWAPVPGDELWWDGFSLPVTDGTVNAAVEFQGSLVIGGRFTRVGETRVNNIARWNGTGWVPLGTGIEWGYVTSLAIHNEDLIAGGHFSFAGGVYARSIARWNGSEWSALGAGLHDPDANYREVMSIGSIGDVLVTAVDASYEYYYGNPSPIPHPYPIKYWTGSSWMDLGPGANGPVGSFATYGGELFAAGAFDSIGGVPAAGVARWDGASWSEVGGGIGTWGRVVSALLVYDGRLIAGGGFDTAGGTSVNNIASWDGTQWEAMGSPPAQVGAMVVQGNSLFAGCVDALVRWNGASWETASPAITGMPADLVAAGEDLFAVGTIEATNPGGEVPVALSVARLNNGTWHSTMAFAGQMRGLTDVGGQRASVYSMVPYRSHIVAAGSFEFCGAPPSWTEAYHLAEWTGTQWTRFPLPSGLDDVYLLLTDGNDLYAAGTFNHGVGVPSSVYRYDGSNWAAVGDLPLIVWSMALFNGEIYVAADDGRTPETSIRRWSGTSWERIGTASGSVYPLVSSLIEYDGKLVAAGRFQTMETVPAANLAAWNGSTWEQFGTGLPSPDHFPNAIVRNLAVHDGDLLAAGDHLQGVQRWTGLAWETLGGLLGRVTQLAEAGGDLFASGYFYTEDSMQSFSLARLHSNQWETLGSGTNETVGAFAALGTSVFMGGWFSEAGGKPSYAIARWDGLSAVPAAPTLHAPRPNPFASTTSLPYALSQSGGVRLSVHDVMGREIDVLEDGFRLAGAHTATWDGRDRLGRRVPSGVYFLRAQLPDGAHQARKVILLH